MKVRVGPGRREKEYTSSLRSFSVRGEEKWGEGSLKGDAESKEERIFCQAKTILDKAK